MSPTKVVSAVAVSFFVGVGAHSMGTRTAVEDAHREGFAEGYAKFSEQIEIPDDQKWEVCGDDGKYKLVPKNKKAAC